MLYVKRILKILALTAVNYLILWIIIYVDAKLPNPNMLAVWYYHYPIWPKIFMAIFGLIFGTLMALSLE